MKKVIALLLALLPLTANAEWIAGGGYYNISDEEGSADISLGAIVASIGYRFDSQGNFFFMPELRVGVGVGDDTVFGVNVEIDTLLAISARGQYDFDNGVYLFGAPSFANLDITASAGGFSVSEDDWEFGVGGGVGFRFSEKVAGEISYETYDGTDVFGAAAKISFP